VEQYAANIEMKEILNYICIVQTHTKELKFMGSVEQQGLQTIMSYDKNTIGVFNKKVSRAICLSDIELAVFENVGYASRAAF